MTTYEDVKKNNKFIVVACEIILAAGGTVVNKSSGMLPYVEFTLPAGAVLVGLRYDELDNGNMCAFWEDNR